MKLKNTAQQLTEITRWEIPSPRPVLKTSGNISDCLLHRTTTSGHEQLSGNKRSGPTCTRMRIRKRMARRAWLWTNLARQMRGPGLAIEETKQNSDRMESQNSESGSSAKQARVQRKSALRGESRGFIERWMMFVRGWMDYLCEWMDRTMGCSFSLGRIWLHCLSPLERVTIRNYLGIINNLLAM